MVPLLCLSFWGATSFADERYRPQSHEEITIETVEKMVRVKGARVAYLNVEAIRRDFPQLKAVSDELLGSWFLDNFAYISESQLKLNGLRNTPIPVDTQLSKNGYRPPRYGRAAVLEVASPDGIPIGMADVKGNGAGQETAANVVERFTEAGADRARINQLRIEPYTDGVMSFGEAIAETTRQTAAQRLFDIYNAKNGTSLQTVETYGIIEIPVDILKEDQSKIRAAFYVRQAHLGRQADLQVPQDIYTDVYGHRQRTYFDAAVDFGGVIVKDPRLKASFGVSPGGNVENPQDSRAWAQGHDVARAFTERGDQRAVAQHLEEMVRPIENEWKSARAELDRRPRLPPISLEKVVLDGLQSSDPKVLVEVSGLLQHTGKLAEKMLPEVTQLFLESPNAQVRNNLHRFFLNWPKGSRLPDSFYLAVLEKMKSVPSEERLALTVLMGVHPTTSEKVRNRILRLFELSELSASMRDLANEWKIENREFREGIYKIVFSKADDVVKEQALSLIKELKYQPKDSDKFRKALVKIFRDEKSILVPVAADVALAFEIEDLSVLEVMVKRLKISTNPFERFNLSAALAGLQPMDATLVPGLISVLAQADTDEFLTKDLLLALVNAPHDIADPMERTLIDQILRAADEKSLKKAVASAQAFYAEKEELRFAVRPVHDESCLRVFLRSLVH